MTVLKSLIALCCCGSHLQINVAEERTPESVQSLPAGQQAFYTVVKVN